MSEYQNNLNKRALQHVSTLSAVRMDQGNYDQYFKEIGHYKYFGVGRELPVLLDEYAEGIEFDLVEPKSPIFVRP